MSSKPTLLAEFVRQEEEYESSTKNTGSKKLVSDAQKDLQTQALKMTDAQIAEEVSKLKKKKSGDVVEVTPSEFKYRLNDKQKIEFLSKLTSDQKSALTSWTNNPDYLVNTPLPRIPRPQSGYFIFGGEVREKMRQEGAKLNVQDVANRIKNDWSKLGDSGQAKYEKIRETQIAKAEAQTAQRPFLKEAQEIAMTYYGKIFGQIIDPNLGDSSEEDHGVKWTNHFKEAHVKKMLLATPNWDTNVSKDVTRVVGAATEAIVVWIGQQLAASAVRANKKTVSGPFLKALSTTYPADNFLNRVESIIALQGDVPKEAKETKAKKSKNDNDDDDEEKPKKDTKATKKEAGAGAMKAFMQDGKQAKSTAFDDDDYEVDSKKAPKAKKTTKKESQDPLFIPTDTDVPIAELTALRKEKSQYDNILEVNDQNGQISYVDSADGEPIDQKTLTKFTKFKSAVAKVQQKSQSWMDHKAAATPQAAKKRKGVPASDAGDDDDAIVQSPKKQKGNKK